jgi:hypothetical protein
MSRRAADGIPERGVALPDRVVTIRGIGTAPGPGRHLIAIGQLPLNLELDVESGTVEHTSLPSASIPTMSRSSQSATNSLKIRSVSGSFELRIACSVIGC